MKNLKKFHETVTVNEGYIFSDGTLNMVHLLSKAYDFINNYELGNSKLMNNILSVFKFEGEMDINESLFHKQYFDNARIDLGNLTYAREVWHEEVYDFFNEISPEGYVFGGSEGDGALIGWFNYEES